MKFARLTTPLFIVNSKGIFAYETNEYKIIEDETNIVLEEGILDIQIYEGGRV